MNDCKITTEFIRLESRKKSYCNIVKLILPQKNKPNEPKILTKAEEIRKKMAVHFQNIFNKLDIDNDTNNITNFLISKDDPEPLNELLRSQIPKDLKAELEGFLTEK